MTIHQSISAYNLNQGQQNAADKFLQFLFSPDKEFIISGPAGVGKTYLMSYIIDNTMPRYLEMCKLIGVKPEFTDVVMTAITNKAADVLSQSVKRPTSTVHSFFNLTVRDDYASGKTILKQTNKWKVHQNLIIFVDESSMIDSELWKMLHDGTMNCKLVYVGDRHQLAPVMEDLSPIYKHDTEMVELTQPVRNANQPALMNICQQLRETVNDGIFKPIEIVPGVIDLLDSQQMQAEIFNQFMVQTHDARILAFTNEQVIKYNDHIRGIRNLPDALQAGEYMVTNNVCHHSKGNLSVESEVEVIRNHGASKILIDAEHNVELDVDTLDLEDTLGNRLSNVPFPTNRTHFGKLTKFYYNKKDWTNYFALKNNFADLRPRDAATVHKSQGSTYNTVFIDIGNISRCNIPSQAARMLYVAFSRAKSRVFLYGDLASKYGGLLQR